MASPASPQLGATDYGVCSIIFGFSIIIGMYYSCTGGKQKTTKEYLLANRGMSPFPVAFSLMASFMSAITLLGVSAENYVYGTQFLMINVSYIIGTPICAFVFLPVFYQMDSSSAYEYLQQRFGKTTRISASVCFILQMTLYMSVVLYAPALALSSVTGVSKWTSIVAVGTVCTLYSVLGGIKAVLWTDVFQSFIMFTSLFAVIIKGSNDVGGVANVWQIAKEGGRVEFFNFDPDPTVRHTVWTLAIGGVFTYVSIYGVNQTQVQRLMTVRNLKLSQIALFMNWPITTLLSITTSFTGLVVYANFRGCDPLSRPDETNVRNADQLLPYFVMKSLGKIPGAPGFFIAGIFSGALSTVSSAINSLAAVTLEDYIRPYCFRGNPSERTMANVSKLLALLFGILCMSLTYVAEQLGGVLQASLTIFGVIGGPLLGLFSLGMLIPFGNQKGAMFGLLVSLGFCFWISFGASFAQNSNPKLPLSTENCGLNSTIITKSSNTNYTHSTLYDSAVNSTTGSSNDTKESVFPLYRLSYMWVAGLGWLISITVGAIISVLSGGNRNKNAKLYAPFIAKAFSQTCDKKNSDYECSTYQF